jgi:hypothetical protein
MADDAGASAPRALPAPPQPPAPPQSTQAQLTTAGGRVGLARSRDFQKDQNASKKPHSKAWVHDQTQVDATGSKRQCNHCGGQVSGSNVTRRKEHLLECSAFLSSQAAKAAAGSDPELKAAVDKH